MSTRTIKRDILELTLSYPIRTVSGKYHSGVYVADDYYYGKQYLSDEQLDLIISLKSKVDDDQQKILESIVKKFGRVKEGK